MHTNKDYSGTGYWCGSGAKQEKTVFTTEPEKIAEDYEGTSNKVEEKDTEQKSWMDEDPEEVIKVQKSEKKTTRKSKSNASRSQEFSPKGSLIIKLVTIIIFSCFFAAVITMVFQKFGSNLYSQFGI